MKLSILIVNAFVIGLWACAAPVSSDDKTEKNAQVEKSNKPKIDTTWQAKIEKPDAYWKTKLSDKQYQILRKKGTEPPFSHVYNANKKAGIYLCAACNNPLFDSNTKFKSGTGWPSFWQPYFSKSVAVGKDNSHGMIRDEVVCGRCGGHLGHVFRDGPKPTGMRYCMNGESLRFVEIASEH